MWSHLLEHFCAVKMCFFLFHFKSSFCSKDILNNCTNFFGHAEKRFDKEAKINFKSFDAIN